MHSRIEGYSDTRSPSISLSHLGILLWNLIIVSIYAPKATQLHEPYRGESCTMYYPGKIDVHATEHSVLVLVNSCQLEDAAPRGWTCLTRNL